MSLLGIATDFGKINTDNKHVVSHKTWITFLNIVLLEIIVHREIEDNIFADTFKFFSETIILNLAKESL